MDFGLNDLVEKLHTLLQLDRLPELAVLLIGVVVGLIGKNLYTIVKGVLGFAGSFMGRLAFGYWQDIRRETPNVIDCALAVVAQVEGRPVLILDALLGPRKLTDVYFNTRTAFGVRIQAFFVKKERPWVYFSPPRRPDRGFWESIRRWRNARRIQVGLAPLPPRNTLAIKYRRVYAPIENLIGQFLTNEWAMQMALGEPCYVFRFVVVLVYEKNADDYIDRQFHAMMIWEETLRRIALDGVVVYQPEFRHRGETLARVAARWREAPGEFGSVFLMVPKAVLHGDYVVDLVPNQTGTTIAVHRPVTLDGANALDAALIQRMAGRSPIGVPDAAVSPPG